MRFPKRGVGRHRYLTAGGMQPGTFDVHLGLTQSDHTTLATVPAHFAGVAALVLGAGYALGRQDKQLLDELA